MSLKEKVKFILEKHPDSRNSDIKLWQLLIWEFYNSKIVESKDGDKAIKMKELFDLPRFSDCQRYRANENAKHIFLPTSEEVLKQRKINEFWWHTDMSPSNPSRG